MAAAGSLAGAFGGGGVEATRAMKRERYMSVWRFFCGGMAKRREDAEDEGVGDATESAAMGALGEGAEAVGARTVEEPEESVRERAAVADCVRAMVGAANGLGLMEAGVMWGTCSGRRIVIAATGAVAMRLSWVLGASLETGAVALLFWR